MELLRARALEPSYFIGVHKNMIKDVDKMTMRMVERYARASRYKMGANSNDVDTEYCAEAIQGELTKG